MTAGFPVSRMPTTWYPELIVVVAGMLVSILTVPPGSRQQLAAMMLVSACLLAAAALARRSPGTALGLTWLALGAHLFAGHMALPIEILAIWIAYGIGRHGSLSSVIATALSVPLAALVVVGLGSAVDYELLGTLRAIIGRFSSPLARATVAVSLVLLPLLAPLGAGIAARFAAASEERQSDLIEEQQARLAADERSAIARDVHDVVGHSLTVILAQAEAGQFVTTEAELRATLERISGVARSSLRDVRTVLADLKQDTSDLRAPLRALAGSGFKVVETSTGTPRPLPPELSTTIRRILQEIVTNVVKHADPSEPVHVAWIWSDNLQVHVSNRPAATPAPDGSGMGIESMTARALAVGGTARVWREGDIVTSHFSIPITRHQEIR